MSPVDDYITQVPQSSDRGCRLSQAVSTSTFPSPLLLNTQREDNENGEKRYREHHTLQFRSGLIIDPPPRTPADLHPVTCRGKADDSPVQLDRRTEDASFEPS
ncbi:unnamed protein product [Pleuronectes platessa]|uniref:Uncharacterized protein n=1 Tax=Pleuronectes platessa TaxID=8262 RepID=A0A9N7TUC5_PLEPL|nr:unnamed protein product [Pleuronectes platessa]